MIRAIKPVHWEDYELIDSGNFYKLERFGSQTLIRPEPQAVWDRSLSADEWEKKSTAIFSFDKNDAEKGFWKKGPHSKEQWFIRYHYEGMKLQLRLGLTGFRHVGVFPEQADNWNFIYERIKEHPLTKTGEKPRVLNLFAYTGGASLAAAAAGAIVSHVDSVKPVINWARENMEASNLDNIRWIVEDALKFVKREVRRGARYQGIMLDPPAYGRGANGEKWVLEEHINTMIKLCAEILDQNGFFILSMYSMGLSALIGENLVFNAFGRDVQTEAGELYIEDTFGKKLPLGTIVRF